MKRRRLPRYVLLALGVALSACSASPSYPASAAPRPTTPAPASPVAGATPFAGGGAGGGARTPPLAQSSGIAGLTHTGSIESALFSGTGLAPGVGVTATVAGKCWESSLADPGAGDAWRCMVGNVIEDPCFSASAQAATVACLGTPWDSQVTVIQLTAPLPAPSSPSPALGHPAPWGMQLADGEHCTLLTGTLPQGSGLTMAYACTNGLASIPTMTTQPWSVTTISTATGAQSQQTISVAWY